MQKTCPIPKEVNFSELTYHSLYTNEWLAHLGLIFFLVLLLRAMWFLDCASHLHRLLRLLVTVATASGRALRRRRRQLADEVKEMRATLRGLVMTDNFAVYSKLERRINAACRELKKTSIEAIPVKIMQASAIRVGLFVFELVLQSWLVKRTPPELFPRQLYETSVTQPTPDCQPVPIHPWLLDLLVTGAASAQRLLLTCLYHLPTRLYTVLVIALCRQWLSLRFLEAVAKLVSSSAPGVRSRDAVGDPLEEFVSTETD